MTRRNYHPKKSPQHLFFEQAAKTFFFREIKVKLTSEQIEQIFSALAMASGSIKILGLSGGYSAQSSSTDMFI